MMQRRQAARRALSGLVLERRISIGVLTLVLWGPSYGVMRADQPGDFGVLVMAHGGEEIWNESVLEAATALAGDHPFEVAFGMANAETLQEATRELEARGVRRIGVVRLFISGESWLERTRQILGLSPGAPTRQEIAHGDSQHGQHDLAATFWRIDTRSSFALTEEGLSEAPEVSEILADRARSLSVDPERESVLLLAHGPADDEENRRWIENLRQQARPMAEEFPFRAVEVLTLREDWDDKREIAELEIRAFVEQAATDNGRCLVIPFRVHGFGPYAEVLEGLEYVSDGRGLLPHVAVSEWMVRQVDGLSRSVFEPPHDSQPIASSSSR